MEGLFILIIAYGMYAVIKNSDVFFDIVASLCYAIDKTVSSIFEVIGTWYLWLAPYLLDLVIALLIIILVMIGTL